MNILGLISQLIGIKTLRLTIWVINYLVGVITMPQSLANGLSLMDKNPS